MKHFNRANIWGQLTSVEEKTTEGGGKPYIEIQVNCQHPRYGAVIAFGRLWGANNCEEFRASGIKTGETVSLTGVLAQYKGRNDATRTNFSFFRLARWNPAESKHSFKRATFILLGEVTAYEEAVGHAKIFLKVRQEPEGYDAREDVFELHVPPGLVLDPLIQAHPGALVRVKGELEQEEDEYGDVTTHARPVIRSLEAAQEKTTDGVPF